MREGETISIIEALSYAELFPKKKTLFAILQWSSSARVENVSIKNAN